jgi:hypothetical protein
MNYLFALVAFPILLGGRHRITVVQRQRVMSVLPHLFQESIKDVCVYLFFFETSEEDFFIADFMKREDN